MDQSTELELAVGGEDAIEIGGAGSVGYLWTREVVQGEDIVDASIRAGPPKPSGTAPMGGSWPQELIVRGLRPGRAVVHLTLARPGQPPRLTWDITVTVSG